MLCELEFSRCERKIFVIEAFADDVVTTIKYKQAENLKFGLEQLKQNYKKINFIEGDDYTITRLECRPYSEECPGYHHFALLTKSTGNTYTAHT